MSNPTQFNRKSVTISQVHRNTNLEIIEITSDKLSMILVTHIHKCKKSYEWQAAVGVFLSLTAALVTADFKMAFGVEGGVWKSLFIVGTLLSGIWVLKSLIGIFKSESIEDLVNRIKDSS